MTDPDKVSCKNCRAGIGSDERENCTNYFCAADICYKCKADHAKKCEAEEECIDCEFPIDLCDCKEEATYIHKILCGNCGTNAEIHLVKINNDNCYRCPNCYD